MKGFATASLHGSADALWYSMNLADAVTQARAGVFPIWAGQSIYQFNGSISPIRIAPAFQYLGVLLDTLTFRSLGFSALQNLLLILLAIGAAATAYLGLRTLLPDRKWLATGLTLLFLSCPGVLGIAYNGNLFMSWTTVPLIPVVLFATVRSFPNRGGSGTLALLGAALGLCWWGHSPIALWATLVAGVAQLARIALQARQGTAWAPIFVGAIVFSAIAAYPIGSVLLYPAEPTYHADKFQSAPSRSVVEALGQVFPGSFLPVSAVGRSQGDFQIGYGLWAVLLFSLWTQRRSWRPSSAVLFAAAIVLAVMLIPVPGLAVALWSAVPAFIRDATGSWPASRFCLLIAGAIVFGAAAGSGSMDTALRRRQLALLVGVGCAWSFAEALRFDADSRGAVESPDVAVDLFRPENVQLSRYSYGFFPHYPALPTTFTHGVTDPELENHLVAADLSTPVSRGFDAALADGHLLWASNFTWVPAGHPDHAELEQGVKIEPNQHYLLEFDFDHPGALHGVLQLSGKHFFREYGLPEHGGSRSFGVGGQHLTVLPLETTAGSESIAVRFFPADPLTPDQPVPASVGAVKLLSYDRADLPVRVDGWIPFRAEVRSPVDAWLETPRVYQTGYTATVNRQPALVRESPETLVCVAVPKGDSIVELTFSPAAGMRTLFWLSLLSIIAAGILGVLKFTRHMVGTSYPAKASSADACV
jgi:hypothetical protein